MRFIITFIFISCTASLSFAASTVAVTGKVTDVASFPLSYGSYNKNTTGLLGIWVEGLPAGCGDGKKRVVITHDHPLHDSALSIALMAKATGKKVEISYFEECTIREKSWDFSYIWLAE